MARDKQSKNVARVLRIIRAKLGHARRDYVRATTSSGRLYAAGRCGALQELAAELRRWERDV